MTWLRMAKLRITFDVDTIELFGMLKCTNGNCEPIGQRLVGAMMTGEAGSADQIGMAYYGIKITSVEKMPAVTADQDKEG